MSTRRNMAATGLALVTLLGAAACSKDTASAPPSWATASAAPATSSSASASGGAGVATATPSSTSLRASAPASVDQPPAADVQTLLANLNYDVRITGSYDAQTITAIKKFQTKHALPVTGVVDDLTRRTMLATAATFKPSAASTDSSGLVFDGVYWSSGSYYRSKNRQCVVYEKQWQDAVAASSKSRSVAAHDDAKALGCDPDVWTPVGIQHEQVNEVHADGEACSKAQAGTVATGSYPWAICNQLTEGVWKWQVMSD